MYAQHFEQLWRERVLEHWTDVLRLQPVREERRLAHRVAAEESAGRTSELGAAGEDVHPLSAHSQELLGKRAHRSHHVHGRLVQLRPILCRVHKQRLAAHQLIARSIYILFY